MSGTANARILIVDDDPVFAKSLCDTLQDETYLITVANAGQDGINAFQSALNDKKPFSVVITDLGMHDVDGYQVAKAVKKASPSTPVILLTGWGRWFEPQDGVAPQVDCILSKPPKLDELRAALEKCLKSNRD